MVIENNTSFDCKINSKNIIQINLPDASALKYSTRTPKSVSIGSK